MMPLQNDIVVVVQNIWKLMFNSDIEQSENDGNFQRSHYSACIQMSGAWTGEVICNASDDLIQKVASTMFQVSEELTTSEQRSDAMGELVNMIGGNLKALLPSPSYLSLPVLNQNNINVNGDHVHFRLPSTNETYHDLSVYVCHQQENS